MKLLNLVRSMNAQESELPTRMASLDICEENAANELPSTPHQADSPSHMYVLRKRPSPAYDTASKRRCTLKPTKLSETDNSPPDYYRYKRKFSVRHLETIYEEPIVMKNGNVRHMGSSKPRKLQLSGITKAKMRHRKLKLKKLRSCKLRIQRKVNMEEFIARFHELMKTKELKPLPENS